MPSILIVTTVDITLEAFLRPFAERLRANGWRVDALSAGATANTHIADSFDRRFDIGWSRSPLDKGSLTSAKRVREVVSAGDYDIVWVHTPVAALMTRYALRNRPQGHPAVVYTAHGFHFLAGGSLLTNLAYSAIERTAAKWTDMLVTINREDTEAARGFSGLPKERVRHIPGIGVDPKVYSAGKGSRERMRGELGLAPDDVAFLMIAEFTPNKRHGLVLSALERVSDPRVKVLFVGEGPRYEMTMNDAERAGLAGRVSFLGYRRDIPDLLAASDAFLLVSKREGLPRSGLEAMAASVPVVGTPTRGITDLVGDGETGWIAASDHPEDVAAAINSAAADAGERERRGSEAYARVESEYAFDHIALRYDAVFAELLGSQEQA